MTPDTQTAPGPHPDAAPNLSRPAGLHGPAVGAAAAGGMAIGALLARAWDRLPGPAQGLLPLLGLVALGAALVAWRRRLRVKDQRAAAEQSLQRQRLLQLERRARQLDEAEHLIDVGSFDWFPGTGMLHWSEQHYRLWGYDPGSVTPSLELFQSHVHPDDVERVSSALQRALQGQVRYDLKHRVLRNDGSVRNVHARGEVFFDDHGQALRMIGAVLDITERVQAEAALRVFEFVLDAMPDPVSVIDDQERYRLTNRAWRSINNRSHEQTIGRTVDDIFPRVVSTERRQAMRDCLAGTTVIAVRAPSPSTMAPGRRIETRYFPFDDPAVGWRGAVMVSRDVTEDEAVRADLAASIGNLRLTLNTIGDAIFASDAAGADEPVLFANTQLLDLWRIAQVPGEPLTPRSIVEHARRLFRDPDAEAARIQAIIDQNLSADDRLELTDGRVLMRRARSTPREPRPVRVWAFRDITAETQALRALAEAEARQRTLLAAFPGYIWVIDQDDRLVYINPTAADLYRPQVPQAGMPIVKLFGPDVTERVRPNLQRTLAGETLSMEWQRRSASGRSPDALLIKMVPGHAPDGAPLCYSFGIDISSLKQAEAALTAARDEAERANQAKTQFLSNMSHELRTPLNAVIGFSQVLEHNAGGNLTARQVRQLGEIRRAGNHLLALINDLLDLARIEAGRTALDLVPVTLHEVVDECLQLVQPLLSRQGLAIEAPASPPMQVLGDRMRIKQVLLNLLSNAIKYNRPEGRVRLAWQASADSVEIEVHDDGHGLSEQAQARLFQPFERLDAEGSDTVGTGIGLALSRQLVQLMDGTIGVRSTVGQGSCFWVRLRPGSSWPGRPLRLLYIDDNPVNLMLVQGLLDKLPQVRLSASTNPRAALADLREHPVDVLLLDLAMPCIDGFEVLARLRADVSTQALPVVAVSADASVASQARCQDLGCIDFVTKPVDAGKLYAALALALKAAEDAAASS